MSALQGFRTQPNISYYTDNYQGESEIKPGDILEIGATEDSVKLGTADNKEFIVAAESVIANDHTYVIGDQVRVAKCGRFCECEVKVSRDAAIAIGDVLSYGAGGALVKGGAGKEAAVALKATTASAGGFQALLVRVL